MRTYDTADGTFKTNTSDRVRILRYGSCLCLLHGNKCFLPFTISQYAYDYDNKNIALKKCKMLHEHDKHRCILLTKYLID